MSSGYASTPGDRRIATVSPYAFEVDYASGDGLTFAATTVSARQVFVQRGNQVVITNTGDAMAHVRWGDSSVAATTASQAVPPGAQLVFGLGQFDRDVTHVAVRTAADTTTVQISRGWGV